jgi:hypothetical protein
MHSMAGNHQMAGQAGRTPSPGLHMLTGTAMNFLVLEVAPNWEKCSGHTRLYLWHLVLDFC